MGWSNIRRGCSNSLRALTQSGAGAAATEFAVIVPVIGLLLTGTMDIAQLANQGLTLDAAARAGAGYAMLSPTNEAGIRNSIQSYVNFAANSVTVDFCGPGSGCPAPTDTFAPPQYCTCDNGTSVACDNSKATCASGPKHFYVTFEVVQTLPTPLLPFHLLPSTLTRTLTVRIS
jgi:Flp pilus assembly pilin Flp